MIKRTVVSIISYKLPKKPSASRNLCAEPWKSHKAVASISCLSFVTPLPRRLSSTKVAGLRATRAISLDLPLSKQLRLSGNKLEAVRAKVFR